MATHMFVLYVGLFSFITPPVALAAYAAAGIAGAPFWKTAVQSMRLGFVKYFIPFFFVYNPALILRGKSPLETLESIATAFLGVFILGSSFEGYLAGLGKLSIMLRISFSCAGFLLFIPERITDLIGLMLLMILFTLIFLNRRYRKPIGKV
jgi:TRAP-type uncharacterized transport system fused permease subunit